MKIRRGIPLDCLLIVLPLLAGCGRHRLGPDAIERNLLFAEILERSDRRMIGSDGFLAWTLEASPHTEAKVWSALALGRIGDPEALPWLFRAFRDPQAGVRAAAAFAVGEIEDRIQRDAESRPPGPGATRELRMLLDDPAVTVRGRAVEALGKAGTSSDAREIARRLESSSLTGSPEERAFLDLAITALMRLNEPGSVPALEKLAGSPDPQVRWRCLNAMTRMGQVRSLTRVLEFLQSADPDVKAHAARALGTAGDRAAVDSLLPLLRAGANSLPVRVSALRALGQLGGPKAADAVRSVLLDEPPAPNDPESVLFATQAAAALGTMGDPASIPVLETLARAVEPVAGNAVIALARLMRGDDAFFRRADAAHFRTGAGLRSWAQAMGLLGGEEAVRSLKGILIQAAAHSGDSPQRQALPAVLRALVQAEAPESADICATFLDGTDGVLLRTAAAVCPPDSPSRAPWHPLIRAYERMAPGRDVEAKAALLSALSAWSGEAEVQAAFLGALKDHQRNTRILASALLRKAGAATSAPQPGPAETTATKSVYTLLASSRKDRTLAILETTRGTFEIELFREDAPLTVANFVHLIRLGFYDGLSFMRVVPYFVVQGGDPRNDMEGGPGYTIRCEINMRPFAEGSVGMALSGKDTGGSQFFITLAPQPHLDGGYTCFGRVISGMPAVRRLVPGDRIIHASVFEDETGLDFRRY